MRRIIASAVVTAAALFGMAFTALADTSAPVRSHRFRLIEHLDLVTFVDDPPAGDSVGDRFTLDDSLFDATNTRQVGRTFSVCTRIGTSPTFSQCVTTVVIGNDSLTAQGGFDLATTTSTLAITGGTGRYIRARGEVTVRSDPASPDEVILEFRLA
jgi:allene oxide cyclase